MNFFTSLIGTCKGTKIFVNLSSQSLTRTFWHLFVMAFICSSFILLCTYSGTSRKMDETFARWEESFGNIKLGENGITPGKVQAAKSLTGIDNSLRLTYLPVPAATGLPEIDAGDINSGFLWTPAMLTFWSKFGPDNFIIMPLAYCSKQELLPRKTTRSTMLSYIKNNTSVKDNLICLFPELSWPAFRDYCKNTYFSAVFFGNIVTILLRVLFFVAMFAFILNLSKGSNATPVLKYRNRFIIGIYASFPPLLIASMFSAFDLPFLSFDSVYVICFSIYLITVFTRLQLELNTRTRDKAL